jgi:hypothetical protein
MKGGRLMMKFRQLARWAVLPAVALALSVGLSLASDTPAANAQQCITNYNGDTNTYTYGACSPADIPGLNATTTNPFGFYPYYGYPYTYSPYTYTYNPYAYSYNPYSYMNYGYGYGYPYYYSPYSWLTMYGDYGGSYCFPC